VVLLPLPVQNLFSNHMLCDICYLKGHVLKCEITCFENRFCTGSGRRTSASKFLEISFWSVPSLWFLGVKDVVYY
jgi:hypothetical protein